MERFFPPGSDTTDTRLAGLRRDVERLKRRNPPAAAAGGSAASWPIEQEIPILSGARGGNFSFKYIDPTQSSVVGCATRNNHDGWQQGGSAATSRTAAAGDYFIVCSRLGPKGSVWWWNIVGVAGPNQGRLRISVATLPEASDGTVDSVTGLTYFDYNADGDPNYMDFYNSTAVPYWQGSMWEMITTGNDGDPITTLTPSGSSPSRFTVDGGAGLYAFKFTVVNKNASSGGYKMDLAQMALHRADAVHGWGL